MGFLKATIKKRQKNLTVSYKKFTAKIFNEKYIMYLYIMSYSSELLWDNQTSGEGKKDHKGDKGDNGVGFKLTDDKVILIW